MRSGAAGWKGREWKDVANPAGCGIIRQSTAREGWQWKRGARPGYLWSPAGTMKRPRCAGRWRRRWRKRGAWIGCGRYAGGDQAKPLRGPASGEGGHHPPGHGRGADEAPPGPGRPGSAGGQPGEPFTAVVLNRIYGATGMKLAEEAGGELNRDFSHVTVEVPQGKTLRSFGYSSWLAGCDEVINFCKLKSHGLFGMTAAVKNLYGVVPGTMKSEYHFRYSDPMKFAHMLVDLNEYVRPAAVPVRRGGYYGGERSHPGHGTAPGPFAGRPGPVCHGPALRLAAGIAGGRDPVPYRRPAERPAGGRRGAGGGVESIPTGGFPPVRRHGQLVCLQSPGRAGQEADEKGDDGAFPLPGPPWGTGVPAAAPAPGSVPPGPSRSKTAGPSSTGKNVSAVSAARSFAPPGPCRYTGLW